MVMATLGDFARMRPQGGGRGAGAGGGGVMTQPGFRPRQPLPAAGGAVAGGAGYGDASGAGGYTGGNMGGVYSGMDGPTHASYSGPNLGGTGGDVDAHPIMDSTGRGSTPPPVGGTVDPGGPTNYAAPGWMQGGPRPPTDGGHGFSFMGREDGLGRTVNPTGGAGGGYGTGAGGYYTGFAPGADGGVGADQMNYVRGVQASNPGMANRLAAREAMHGNRGSVGENGLPNGNGGAPANPLANNPTGMGFDQHIEQFSNPANYERMAHVYPPAYINSTIAGLQHSLANPAPYDANNPFGGGISPQARHDLERQLAAYQQFQQYQQSSGVMPGGGPAYGPD